MASKDFKKELTVKTGHDLAWFQNLLAGCKGGLKDVSVHLRETESMKHAAEAARDTAESLLRAAELLDPSKPSRLTSRHVVRYTVVRTPATFGCKTLGYVDRDGCRDEEEEWRRLGDLAKTKGYEILSREGNVAFVRLPR